MFVALRVQKVDTWTARAATVLQEIGCELRGDWMHVISSFLYLQQGLVLSVGVSHDNGPYSIPRVSIVVPFFG